MILYLEIFAIIGILNSVVALYYYFRIVKAMYFDESKVKGDSEPEFPIYIMIVLNQNEVILKD